MPASDEGNGTALARKKRRRAISKATKPPTDAAVAAADLTSSGMPSSTFIAGDGARQLAAAVTVFVATGLDLVATMRDMGANGMRLTPMWVNAFAETTNAMSV